MGRLGRLTLGAGLAIAAIGAMAPAAHGRDAVVNSFDGTPIITHFFPAPGSAQNPAPTIMIGHGWGGSGATSPPAVYADAGFNVLTWDARGFGGSGGTVMIDHPDFEAKDAQALIDFIAQQPEAQLDGGNDPRVGMDGPSYGGGVQLITASQDPRVDAITPTIAWNKLTTSLYKANNVKLGWSAALVALGIPTSLLPGVFSPAGVQTGNQSPQFFSLVTNGVATGRFTAPDVAWLAEHGPDHLLPGLSAPTMIVQGTVDTLFTLDEAHRNFIQLKSQGTPVKMMWFCGGHGACLTGTDAADPLSGLTGDGGLVGQRKLAWFKKYLQGSSSADTGPEFEWIDEDGAWHESGAYPQTQIGTAAAQGAGTLALSPGVNAPGAGVAIFATPSLAGSIDIPVTPPAGSQILGEPKLDLDYTATGVSGTGDGKTHVYAQLVDTDRNVVVNNQATPIPIELDSQPHQITVGLERIASLSTASGYELQLIPQTTLYDAQRATGTVTVTSARIELPVTEPVPIPQRANTPISGPAQTKCKKAAKKKRKKAKKRDAVAAKKKKKRKKPSCKRKRKKRKKAGRK